MKISTLKAIFNALEKAQVRYLVAGGVAVVVHGYQRMTMDLDIVLQLKDDNIQAAFNALKKLDYRPSVPVSVEDFADSSKRRQWIQEKGMRVLNLFSDMHPETSLDVFVSEPFDFNEEYKSALHIELEPGLMVRVVSISTLIAMKKHTGRSLDNEDVKQLQQILKEQRDG